jgi:hypothetical protein
MRRLSPRRVPEQRSRPLQVIGWQGLALLIPVEASAEPGDAEGTGGVPCHGPLDGGAA